MSEVIHVLYAPPDTASSVWQNLHDTGATDIRLFWEKETKLYRFEYRIRKEDGNDHNSTRQSRHQEESFGRTNEL